MKVCYFGTFEENCPRNMTIKRGLELNGVEIVKCNSNIWEKGRTSFKKGRFSPLRAVQMVFVYAKLSVKYIMLGKHDAVFVGYPGYLDVFPARILSRIRRKPLVFDSYLSIYDSMVFDRKLVDRKSVYAKFLFFLDKFSCTLPDAVLLDTNEHISYYCREFGLAKNKFLRIPIGADDSIFRRMCVSRHKGFVVEFHGTFIPLQGVEFILDAARLLPKVKFKLIGNGQTFGKMTEYKERMHLDNVEFMGFMDQRNIPAHIASSDVVLGLFGKTGKTRRVISNKIFEAMAMGVPIITADTPAAREWFTDQKDCILCNTADGRALASAIKLMMSNSALRNKVAANGYKLFKSEFTPLHIGRVLREQLEIMVR
jgi:glycosyltransferase involved in cell wall biosynthesis